MPSIFMDPVTLAGVEWNGATKIEGARFICDILDGWDDTAALDVVVSPAGTADGGVASSRFPMQEKYLYLGGAVHAPDRASAERARLHLMRALQQDETYILTRTEALGTSQMEVRLAGKITLERPVLEGFRILIPLLAEDPLKYGPEISAAAGAYGGGEFYKTYSSGGEETPPSTYAPDRVWDYSTGDLSQWNDAHGPDPVVVNSDHPFFPKAARFTLNDNARETWDGTFSDSIVRRTEMSSGDPTNSGSPSRGQRQFWSWSTKFPTGMVAPTNNPTTGGWLCWTQFHHTGPTCPTPFWLDIVPGSSPPRAILRLRGGLLNTATCTQPYSASIDLGPVALGTWQDWEVDVTWHDNSASGYIGIWKDGVQVANNLVANLYQNADGTTQGMYVKQGLYGNRYTSGSTAGSPTEPQIIVEHTGLRRGSTAAKVSTASANPVATYYETYDATTLSRTYDQAISAQSESIVIDNTGDATSYPVSTVTGPLAAGGWYIYNEDTNKTLSFDIAVSSSQTLVIDHKNQTALLDGYGVEHTMRGEWFGLRPGVNRIQLVSSEFNATARLVMSARPARR